MESNQIALINLGNPKITLLMNIFRQRKQKDDYLTHWKELTKKQSKLE